MYCVPLILMFAGTVPCCLEDQVPLKPLEIQQMMGLHLSERVLSPKVYFNLFMMNS